MNKNGKMVNCIICETEFYVSKSRMGKIKCCSSECASKSQRKQICINGHDTAVCGRYKSGACIECERLRSIENNTVQFCEEGHDTFVTGRYKGNGRCIACSDLPSKQFCKNNHDTFIYGRDKTGYCKECFRLLAKQKYDDLMSGKRVVSHKNNICSRGHDKNIVGWTPTGRCVQCDKERAGEWYDNNTERANLAAREYYMKNKERLDAINAKWTKDHPENVHNSHWKHRGVFNLDGTRFLMKDYDEAFKLQEGKCAICKRHQKEFKKALAADHDHKTGFFRGLLCSGCNIGLGIYEKLNKGFESYLNLHDKNVKKENKYAK